MATESVRKDRLLVLVVWFMGMLVAPVWSQAGRVDPSLGPFDPVPFADPKLKAAVERTLGFADPVVIQMGMLLEFYAQDSGISNLEGLQYAGNLLALDLTNNPIRDLTALTGLRNLFGLSLSNTMITDLTPLTELSQLMILNLSLTQISDISVLSNLKQLSVLYLFQNEIWDISSLADLVRLTKLVLSHNEITDITALAGLSQLTELNLGINQISDISPLSSLSQLAILELPQNHLEDITPLAPLTGLQTLNLFGNQVGDLSALRTLTQLTNLDLLENHVVDVSPLEHLDRLTRLDLSSNRIVDISPLASLTNLQELRLSFNQIHDISALASLTGLETLYLMENDITDGVALGQITALNALNLHNNHIGDISGLRMLSNLRVLDLSRNEVVDISEVVSLEHLELLNLSDNPLSNAAYCQDIPYMLEAYRDLSIVYDRPEALPCKLPERVLFVDRRAPEDQDGVSWNRAYHTLQEALAAARYGDTICVAQGVYKPTEGLSMADSERMATFRLKNGIKLQGGYAGLASGTDPNLRDPQKYETVLSGDLLDNDQGPWNHPSRKDNSLHVVTGHFVNHAARLDGFTITSGHADDQDNGGGIHTCGGGMIVGDPMGTQNLAIALDSGPVVANCHFKGNYAYLWGGGLWCDVITLDQCTFTGNHAELQGGGLFTLARHTDLEQCQFQDNSAGKEGGGVYSWSADMRLTACSFSGNEALRANALWMMGLGTTEVGPVTLDGIDIADGIGIFPSDVGRFEDLLVHLEDDLNIESGTLEVASSRIEGEGSIRLGEQATLVVAGVPQAKRSAIATDITGSGGLIIRAGQQLVIGGDSIVNLSGLNGEVPDPATGGRITVHGSLVLQDNATLESTNIQVKLLDVNTPSDVQYNNITLQEASPGFGGEFFVSGNARIQYNRIVSEGDRYLDLDPDPENRNLHISNNTVEVIIKAGKPVRRGTLLELRAHDYDWGTSNNSLPTSGIHQVDDSDGFTEDPSENWVLEKLELQENAKLNLTNRQGFRYQDPLDPLPETVYARELVMGPNSVLNTALQTLYYQDLIIVDSNGEQLEHNPVLSDEPFLNNAEFKDIPLLGFSLGVVAMNDEMPSPHNEFDIRVRQRLTDPSDEQPDPDSPSKIGSMELIRDNPTIPPGHGGVMEMRTQAPGKQSASSVAAKGAFARAGDEDITIEFEYLFLDDPDGQAELIVYLSDHPEVSKDYYERYEVARVYPPAPGRPGAIGSSEFGFFSGTFLRNELNFTRGTYVELELRGNGARCWIDNWDPQVNCIAICGDYDNRSMSQGGIPGVNVYDYLVMLAEFGLTNPSSVGKGCLDLIPDGFVNTNDLLAWGVDGLLSRSTLALTTHDTISNSTGLFSFTSEMHTADPNDPLRIAGKPSTFGGADVPDTLLYDASTEGLCKGTGKEVVDELSVSGGGRLIMDGQGYTCQIHAKLGLTRPDTGEIILKPDIMNLGKKSVSIGLIEGAGLPLLDAAFEEGVDNTVYVVPVQVRPENGNAYAAAAKLRLTIDGSGKYTGAFDVLNLYGTDPAQESAHHPTNSDNTLQFKYEPDLQHLHEIEVDHEGMVYVLNAHIGGSESKLLGNNWLLVYDGQGGGSGELRVSLDELGLTGPTAMVVSSHPGQERLFLASSASDASDPGQLRTQIYWLALKDIHSAEPNSLFLNTIDVDCPTPIVCLTHPQLCDPNLGSLASITSMCAHPYNGDIYITGFVAPRFSSDGVLPIDEIGEYFTTPIFAAISPTEDAEAATIIAGSDLALPLSMIWSELDEQSVDEGAVVGFQDLVPSVDHMTALAHRWLTLNSTAATSDY